MPSLEIEFSVYCGKCGNGLCQQTETDSGDWRSEPKVTVEPCEKCMEEAKDEGYEQGQKDAED